ncbi:MAG: 3-deoxy-manno-octulosonate cytidylyltransferase [Flavobacteriales bacterium]
MRIGFLITARLRSTRLRRKLLLPLDDSTVIGKVIERAVSVPGMDQVVLCTSDLPDDDELEIIASEAGIGCFRGSPEDVLQRLRDACHAHGFDGFVGITGENPLFHPPHCEMARDHLIKGADLVRFTGLPIGCAPYGVGLAALRTICDLKEEVDTEIWGYLLNRPEIFDVHDIQAEPALQYPDIRVTIDYPEDLELIRALFSSLPGMPALQEVIAMLRSDPKLERINATRAQADLPSDVKQRLDAFFSANALRIRNQLGVHRAAMSK